MVYVRSKDGKVLMPTERHGHVRHLLKAGLAHVMELKPFTIQLDYGTDNMTQRVFFGEDPGYANIGGTAVREDGKPLISVHLETRTKEIPGLMKARKEHRQKHRKHGRREVRQRRARKCNTTMHADAQNRALEDGRVVWERVLPGCEKPIKAHDIRNKEARFANRIRETGWLTPTAKQLLNTHLRLVEVVSKYVPVTDVVLEVNKFAFMELDNPDVRKIDYRKGPLYGQGDLHSAIYRQQGGKCLFCGKGSIEHYHHLIPKHLGGSDTIANMAGLCNDCHGRVHTEKPAKKKLAGLKAGMLKKYGALSVLNQIIPHLLAGLGERYPGHAYVTTGYSTKGYRDEHDIAKDHNLDAYCIAMSVLPKKIKAQPPTQCYELKQFRRHDRKACHHENVKRKYILDGKVVAVNRHRAFEQKEQSLEEYVLAGGKTDCLKVKPHKVTYQRSDRVMPGAVFMVNGSRKVMKGSDGLHNGKPDYYKFTDGTKAAPKKCRLMKNNTGIAFV